MTFEFLKDVAETSFLDDSGISFGQLFRRCKFHTGCTGQTCCRYELIVWSETSLALTEMISCDTWDPHLSSIRGEVQLNDASLKMSTSVSSFMPMPWCGGLHRRLTARRFRLRISAVRVCMCGFSPGTPVSSQRHACSVNRSIQIGCIAGVSGCCLCDPCGRLVTDPGWSPPLTPWPLRPKCGWTFRPK